MTGRSKNSTDAVSALTALASAIAALRRRDLDGALRHARLAADLAPDDPTAFLVLGRILARTGRRQPALDILSKAAALAADDFKVQYRAGRFCLTLRAATAIGPFERALAVSPDNGPALIGLATALTATRKFAAALRAARRAYEVMPGSAKAAGQLGIALVNLGENDKAIGVLLQATDRLSNWVEALLQLGRALVVLERYQAALPHLRRAVALDPRNLNAHSALIRALVAARRLEEAYRSIDAGISQGLDGDSAAELRADCDAARRVQDTSLLPVSVAFTPRTIDVVPASSVGAAALEHARVVWALVLRELRTRFGRNRLGYVWAFLEPILHVASFGLIFTLVGRRVPHDMTVLTLLTTGIVPWLAFQSTYSHIQPAFAANRSLLYFRQVTLFDMIVARALLELATKFVVLGIMLLVLDATGEAISMRDPLLVFGSMFGMWVAGFGVGMLVAPITTIFPAVNQLVSLTIRVLYFMSGVFFTIREVHPILRPYALYNPFLHFIESLRTGFFAQYEAAYVDLAYAWSFAIAAVFFGLAAERALRRQIMR